MSWEASWRRNRHEVLKRRAQGCFLTEDSMRFFAGQCAAFKVMLEGTPLG